MLSLRELRRAAQVIREKFTNARLRRITGIDEYALALTLETDRAKSRLMFSAHPDYARVCLLDPPGPEARTNSFCEYVRAHLIGSALTGVEVAAKDRQMSMRWETRAEAFTWIFSIQGARSNIYLLDAGGRLVHSMRPHEETRRELEIGEAWFSPHGAAPSEGIDRWAETPDALYLEAVGNTYQRLEQKRKVETLAQRIRQAVKKERSFLHRKYIHLHEDLEEAQRAEAYKEKGEMLKGVLHTVRAGDDSVKATDYRTGELVEIPLNPKILPAANLEAYFARYQKDSRGVQRIRQQLEDLDSARAELDRIEAQLENALMNDPPDAAALESLSAQRAVLRLINRHAARKKPMSQPGKTAGKKQIPARLLPKRYRTEEGLEIWVGRSDEGNDYLTARLARGNDLFFHLEGYPGSHVVLRTEGRLDPSPGSLLDACELAVHFSKLKNAGSADVHVAPVKDVRKPKGAKPGLVYVRSGKTIRLRRDPDRLENILSSRIDD